MSYPASPGWKEAGTSREAAQAIQGRAGTLRRAAYAYIQDNPNRTADEIARGLNETPLAIRPRISELRGMGMIKPVGRGRNSSGKAAHTWRVVEWGE